MSGIADKWVCASFFGPTHWERDAFAACGAWSGGIAYLLFAAATLTIVYMALVFLLTYYGAKQADAFGISALFSVPSAILWPIATFLAPVAILGFGAIRMGKAARSLSQRRIARTLLRDAEDAKRAQELAPYIAQLEKEMAQ